jgi:hypothetical protein
MGGLLLGMLLLGRRYLWWRRLGRDRLVVEIDLRRIRPAHDAPVGGKGDDSGVMHGRSAGLGRRDNAEIVRT